LPLAITLSSSILMSWYFREELPALTTKIIMYTNSFQNYFLHILLYTIYGKFQVLFENFPMKRADLKKKKYTLRRKSNKNYTYLAIYSKKVTNTRFCKQRKCKVNEIFAKPIEIYCER